MQKELILKLVQNRKMCAASYLFPFNKNNEIIHIFIECAMHTEGIKGRE